MYFTVSYSTGSKKSVSYISDSKALTDMNFTGQHRCSLVDSNRFQEGLIVSATGKYFNHVKVGGAYSFQNHITIDDSLPVVEITNIENDKRVFGVLSRREASERVYSKGSFHTLVEKPNNDDRFHVSSLGEGAIWVCNHNGNITNGDYIVSYKQGYGQRSKTKNLQSSTVAKATMNCDFNPPDMDVFTYDINMRESQIPNLTKKKYQTKEIEVDGIKYKAAFIGCTYHCG